MPPLAALSIPELVAVIGGTIGAGTGLAQTGMTIAHSVGGDDAGPDPMVAAKAQQDAADKARLRGVIGGHSIQDAQTRTSGSASNDFLANVATSEAGTPNLQGDAMDMVKKLLAGGGGGTP
ncbi:MAG: hypothetical protein D4R44_08110 [Actinobacteria bacterium]|nr:MAG: hypothetical protein D4R44_08110 [Actinomycetota bacterium]